MAERDLLQLTLADAATAIRGREISPIELTEAALAEAERLQPVLCSFITILRDSAMRAARESEAALSRGEYRGPLHGIPIGIKDNLATAGIRSTVGSKVLENFVPDEDAEVVRRCKDAGAIILGKENLEEFAAGMTSNNAHYGAVHNPWNLDHVPGGSSGGGGANVAAGVTFASLGTDFGGSVRLPGTFCGIVGLKQTFGRVSQRGLLVTSFNGDHIGPMTRTVRDCALMLQVMAGYDPLEPSTVPVPVPDYGAALGRDVKGLKIGVPVDHYFDHLHAEVDAAVRQAIIALERLGMSVREVSLPMMKYAGAMRLPTMADSVVTHEPLIEKGRSQYGPHVLYRTLAGQFVLGTDYAKGMKVQRLIKEEHARVLSEVDVLVTPTAPIPAPRIADKTVVVGNKEHPVRGPGSGSVSRNTSPSNSTGLPAISVPCGFTSSGLPIGVQLIGRAFDEARLLQIAHAYESVSPARGRRPPIVQKK
jgi:aspartyl-tRNA(Asn)/glutamyl-tRNA(Gln) amidotransferase subunit A